MFRAKCRSAFSQRDEPPRNPANPPARFTPPIPTRSLRLKHLIASQFRLDLSEPDLISDDEPLVGGSLGLDSLDALELAITLEEEFGLTIHSRYESQRAFANIRSLAGFTRTHWEAEPHPTIAAIDMQTAAAPSVG